MERKAAAIAGPATPSPYNAAGVVAVAAIDSTRTDQCTPRAGRLPLDKRALIQYIRAVSRTEADASTVGATIEALAGAYRVRQDELADLAGISKQALNNIIRGRSMPSLATANALASLFGISTQKMIEEPTGVVVRASVARYETAPIHEARRKRGGLTLVPSDAEPS